MKNVIIAFLFICGLGGGFFIGFVGVLLLPIIIITFTYLLIKNKDSFFTETKELIGIGGLRSYEPKSVAYQFDNTFAMIESNENIEQEHPKINRYSI